MATQKRCSYCYVRTHDSAGFYKVGTASHAIGYYLLGLKAISDKQMTFDYQTAVMANNFNEPKRVSHVFLILIC